MSISKRPSGDTAADMPVLKRPYCEILDDCKGTFVDCLQPTSELFDYLTERQVGIWILN